MTLKVYLAGPEVFLPNGREIIAAKQALLGQFGFSPSARQGEFVTWTNRVQGEIGREISRHNEALIEEADLLIANLTPFRSISADPGTVFELGYMCALGRPVFAHSNDARDYGDRVRAEPSLAPVSVVGEKQFAKDGSAVENHGFADNLMLDGGILRRDGVVIRKSVPPETIWTDLTALAECLDRARSALASL